MYEDTPDDMVHDLMATAAYGEHPLAYPILGTEERLKAMGSNDLRAYMKEHYTIENTVISIAGNIDDSVIELMENTLDHLTFMVRPNRLPFPNSRAGSSFTRRKRNRTTFVFRSLAAKLETHCSLPW